MRRIGLTIVLAALGGFAPTETPAATLPPLVVQYIEFSESQRDAAIVRAQDEFDTAEKNLAAAKAGRVSSSVETGQIMRGRDRKGNLTYTFPSRKAKESFVNRTTGDREAAKFQLDTLKAGQAVYVPELEIESARVGQGGMLKTESRQHVIRQVIDHQTMLVAAEDYHGRELALFWLEGIGTQGAVDGRAVTTHQVLIITGTTTYNTLLGGTRTVFVVKPVPLEGRDKEIRDYLTKRRLKP